MELNEIQRVYFIGIGGIGMSALARYFKRLGKNVRGYDRTRGAVTDALEKEGIPVHFMDLGNGIPGAFSSPEGTLVVYTPAVPADLGELQFFRENGFTLKKRAEVLGMISNHTRCLAVAGTHGKTTTSCILAHLLQQAGLPIMAFLGGVSEDLGSNFVMNGTDFSVVEADEFDRSFLWLKPEIACVTSMDADHLDIYGTKEALEDTFRAFAGQLKPGGKLIVPKGLPLQGITYGIEDDSDFCIRNLRIESGAYLFDLHTPSERFDAVRFQKPGRHNLMNGLAAFAMAVQVTDQTDRLVNALGSFKGVQRRFSYKIKTEELIFIDDYAHHPSEIDAVHQAVREMHPDKKVLAIFQPHLFSRTRDFGEAFGKSLGHFDQILLLEIYPAREKPIEGINSAWLMDRITNPNKNLIEKAELISEINRLKPQILITMGAGDIGNEVNAIKNALSHAS
ncbi:UDP-N-acetylmuramate--L-alanine ligase [Robiginitalea sp. IMCC43444]|uniref:UDP-N-acetylmuramate--L-alanine ligase n=1 Tax=Robiginitalea sp. IMCC43444 TaxID=3459121 RepID=UPI0040412C74